MSSIASILGPAKWSEKYLNIPFVDKGFDEHGCHCWGLVYLIYRCELGIILEKYAEFSAKQSRDVHKAISTGKSLKPWVPVAGKWKEFDVAVMFSLDDSTGRMTVLQNHVGVVTAERYILHIEAGINSANMDIRNPWMRRRVCGVFRHEDMVCE